MTIKNKKAFLLPKLVEYGPLEQIVGMPHKGVKHEDKDVPPGLVDRLDEDECDDVGPKKADKADAFWHCGSS